MVGVVGRASAPDRENLSASANASAPPLARGGIRFPLAARKKASPGKGRWLAVGKTERFSIAALLRKVFRVFSTQSWRRRKMRQGKQGKRQKNIPRHKSGGCRCKNQLVLRPVSAGKCP
jgi:hypothetical protein